MLVRSLQKQLIFSEICRENFHKTGHFLHFLSVLLLKEQMIISVKKGKDAGQITAKAIDF